MRDLEKSLFSQNTKFNFHSHLEYYNFWGIFSCSYKFCVWHQAFNFVFQCFSLCILHLVFFIWVLCFVVYILCFVFSVSHSVFCILCLTFSFLHFVLVSVERKEAGQSLSFFLHRSSFASLLITTMFPIIIMMMVMMMMMIMMMMREVA